MKNIKLSYMMMALAISLFSLSSCDDFLDETPDSRTEIDNETKVIKILTEGYPHTAYIQINELMSDNHDTYREDNPNTSRYYDEVWNWSDVTESNNESPQYIWSNGYQAIANANIALEAIESMGEEAMTIKMRECKAEALLCRAYGHFMLANEFCMAYSSKDADKQLGIPYIENSITELNPHFPRGTVAELYAKIDRDIQEALPLVGESHLTIPKYHFNERAAYAFAARFYNYYEKWDKALHYANLCLGSSPATVLRSYKALAALGQGSSYYNEKTNLYIDAEQNCNLLLLTTRSNPGTVLGNTSTAKKYAHIPYIANNEDIAAQNIWVDGSQSSVSYYWIDRYGSFSGSNIYVIFYRLPRLFEYTDPVAGIGYNSSVYPAFTTDECLLNRAEAEIMLGQYEQAAADLNTWMHNIVSTKVELDPEYITNFYNKVDYSYIEKDDDPDAIGSTIKKHLNPKFEIDEEGSTQECMLQCLLGFRRM
ncbi:MAG: RagB/SusD family nutrient uptake outer membrane protein, partial [Prevotella sp.]|nr:RagB/SusD family nutrient uptake outer membrane protein [Prevotella sp.]